MNIASSTPLLERKFNALRRKLLKLGPLHPGSLSRQYQVCGNPTCRCMKAKDPQRHGPYYKLAYVYHGKPVCRFVRADSSAELQSRLKNYKTFRQIIDALINLSIQQGKTDFFASPSIQKNKTQVKPSRRTSPVRRQAKATPT